MSRVMDRLQARQGAFLDLLHAGRRATRIMSAGGDRRRKARRPRMSTSQPCGHELVQALPRDVLFAANGTREEEGFGDVTDKS